MTHWSHTPQFNSHPIARLNAPPLLNRNLQRRPERSDPALQQPEHKQPDARAEERAVLPGDPALEPEGVAGHYVQVCEHVPRGERHGHVHGGVEAVRVVMLGVYGGEEG